MDGDDPRQRIQTLRLRLTALSPVHIGGAEQTLDNTEYLVTGNRVFVVDTDTLFRADVGLMTEEKLRGWLLGEKQSLTTLNRERRNAPPIKWQDVALYNLSENANLSGESQYRPFVRDGRNRAYVPGSSLKGALRNAWLAHYMEQHPNERQKAYDKIKDAIDHVEQIRDFRKEIDGAISDDVFRRGFGDGQQPPIQADMFRAITVSDSPPLRDRSLAAEDVRVMCDYFEPRYDQRGDLVLYEKTAMVQECIQEGESFEVTLGLKTWLLTNFYRKPDDTPSVIRDLLVAADLFARTSWEYEAHFFETGQRNPNYRPDPRDRAVPMTAPGVARFYSQQPPQSSEYWLVRLGAGGGIFSKTTDHIISDGDAEMEYGIGRYGFWQGQDKAHDFPKSRKIAYRAARRHNSVSGLLYPPGWCKMEIVG